MNLNAQLVKELRKITQAGIMDCKKALEVTKGHINNAIIWLRENGLAKASKKLNRIAAEGIVYAKQNDQKVVILEVNSETDFLAQNEKFIKLINEVSDVILTSDAHTLETALALTTPTGETIEQSLINAIAIIGEKIQLRRFTLITKDARNTIALYNHANKRISVVLNFKGTIEQSDAYNVAMHVAAMNPMYKNIKEIPTNVKELEISIIKAKLAKNPKLQGKSTNVLENILKGKLLKRLSELSLVDQQYVVDENFKVGQFLKFKKVSLIDVIRYEVGEGIKKVVTNSTNEVAAQSIK